MQWNDKDTAIFFSRWPTHIEKLLDGYARTHEFTENVLKSENNIYLRFLIEKNYPSDGKSTQSSKSQDALRGILYLLVNVRKVQFYEVRKKYGPQTGRQFDLFNPVSQEDFYEEDLKETMDPIEKA